jgi:hypothetical protein
MIQSSHASAYPSPFSTEMLKDYQQHITQRVATTEQVVRSSEDKIQKNIDPELTKPFDIEVKTLVDIYA